MRFLVLMRHAKAYKNVEDRHGGPGTGLALGAEEEVEAALERLPADPKKTLVVYTSPVPQARETARILANHLQACIVDNEDLRPLDLGVLSGLSREEALRSHPQVATRMELWRSGEIEINQLQIPGAEDLTTFFNRGIRFLDSIQNDKVSALVVGTRSILILLASILLGRTPEPGGGYREVPFRNSQFLVFCQHGRSWSLDSARSHFDHDVLSRLRRGDGTSY